MLDGWEKSTPRFNGWPLLEHGGGSHLKSTSQASTTERFLPCQSISGVWHCLCGLATSIHAMKGPGFVKYPRYNGSCWTDKETNIQNRPLRLAPRSDFGPGSLSERFRQSENMNLRKESVSRLTAGAEKSPIFAVAKKEQQKEISIDLFWFTVARCFQADSACKHLSKPCNLSVS